MGAGTNAPVIIKRKKVIAGEGHHGGAWKVAYADFVTAMMAFFMLMWLLNATTEQQRKGIADYFSPTVPLNRASGGGDGMFGGDSIFSQENMAENGSGGSTDTTRKESPPAPDVAVLREIDAALIGQGGEAMLSDSALRHVVTRVTDEGLVIEVFSLPDARIFQGDTTVMSPELQEVIGVVARLSGMVTNGIAVDGYVQTKTLVLLDNPNWPLSSDRAEIVREALTAKGVDEQRLRRVTGHADRKPVDTDPAAIRNERIEIILLRSDQ